MQALMLAAGMGKRMRKYTENCTKCMVSVSGKTLIERAIEALKRVGITKLILVVGYEGQKLVEFLQEKVPDMEYEFVYNDVYDTTNNIYSLYLAKEQLMQDDTILLESDLIYQPEIIKKILDAPYENMVAVAKYEHWMDGTVVLLDEEQNILEFVEKVDFRYEQANQYYKTVNIYKFSRQFSVNQYVPFLSAYVKAYGNNQYYELVLKILAHIKYSKMKACVIDEFRWYEIDDEQDLEIANTLFAEDSKQLDTYNQHYGGYWRFPLIRDFCYLVNPYYPPMKMIQQIQYFSETLLRQYPSGSNTQRMNMGRLLNIDETMVVVGNGAAELISILGKVICGRMTVFTPNFNEYIRCFEQCRIRRIDSSRWDYAINGEIILSHLAETDIVAIVNPDNPSGNFIEEKDLLAVLDYCNEQNILCIIDESFIDFAEEEIRYTLLKDELLVKYPNLLVIKSISKSYGIPGLRLGTLATSNKAIIEKVKVAVPIWNINSFAEYFLQIHALYQKEYMVACDKIVEQRNAMIKRLEGLNGVKCYASQANYIMCSLKNGMTATYVANRLLKEYSILIKDLSQKVGIHDSSYIRIAVKDEQENSILLDAIEKIMN